MIKPKIIVTEAAGASGHRSYLKLPNCGHKAGSTALRFAGGGGRSAATPTKNGAPSSVHPARALIFRLGGSDFNLEPNN